MFRLKSSRFRLAWLGAALVLSQPTLAGESYDALAQHKAMAVHSSNPALPYVAQAQQNKLAAATMALRACQQAQPQTSNGAYCELVQLNETGITTAEQIKAARPSSPHPLYLWHYQSEQSNVYLAGSVHILKSGLYPLPPQYQQAFDASNKLVLEVNLSAFTPEQLQFKSMQYGMLPSEQRIGDVLPPKLYMALENATAEYGLPLQQLASFKPSFLVQQLVVLAMMSLGYDPNEGVEKHFVDQAGERDVLELESIDFQLGLLMNQPIATQQAMVADTLEQLAELEPLTTDLMTAWLTGDDARFAQAFELQTGASEASQAFMTALMDERNVGMTDKITGYLQSPGDYFVLIGSGHFVGDNNIIELLEKRGIRGKRIFSNNTIAP